MKKFSLFLILCSIVASPAYAADVSPSTGSCDEMIYSLDDFDNNSGSIWDTDSGDFIADWNGSGVPEPICPDFDGGTFSLPNGNYSLVECSGTCTLGTYEDALIDSDFVDEATFTVGNESSFSGSLSASSATSLMTETAKGFGMALVMIVTFFLGIGAGVLTFQVGWRKVQKVADDRLESSGRYSSLGTDKSPVRAFRNKSGNIL